MALFDPQSPSCEEAAALYTARTLLSQSSALQQLFEVDDDDEALPLIIPGPVDPPLDGETYSIDELVDTICYAQLYPNPDEDSLLVIRSKAVGAVSEKEGFFRLHIRRQIRESEWAATGGRQDVFLFFMDRTGRMCEQFIEAADLNLASESIRRRVGPLFSRSGDTESQGRCIWADFLISWGGSENNE